MRKPLSLRAQAVALLAQREHSERELRLKLLRRLQRRAAADAAQAQQFVASDAGSAPDAADLQAQLDEVINWLLQQGYLDEQRFVASRVHLRSARCGVARIAHELSRHGLDLSAETAQALRASELERATAIWQRRYGQAPADARAAARQARFLAGRGFSSDVIRRILRTATPD